MNTSLPMTCLAVLCALALGCAMTQQEDVSSGERQASCAFLGPDVCGKLEVSETPTRFQGEPDPAEALANLRYLNPDTNWRQYKQVILPPVTFWGDDQTKLSAEDQQKLIDFFHAQLEQQLGAKFPIVQEPGPGVMSVQVALVDAESSTPVMRSISMALPQARILGRLRYLATGSYGWVGGATAEVKISDSVNGTVLAAAVDRRIGGANVKNAAQWEWGDTEEAMKFWSQQIAERLSAWTQGIPSPAPPS
jgi:hypothetical protein